MFRKSLGICICLASAISLASAANIPASRANLSATEIVDKNIAARGGLKTWRAIQTISMEGKLSAGGNQQDTLPTSVSGGKRGQQTLTVPSRPAEEAQLPFVRELKRSHKSRMELQFNGKTAIQVFDGSQGWKLRPFLNRHEVEPYTLEEMKMASQEEELDGPFVDYTAKGSKVELSGTERVGDRETYKLALTTRDGRVQHIWVDSQNYLEVKAEGSPRRLDGKLHTVEIYFSDYRTVPGGVVVPYLLETRVEGVKQTEKIQIETVLVNPQLDDKLFSKPN